MNKLLKIKTPVINQYETIQDLLLSFFGCRKVDSLKKIVVGATNYSGNKYGKNNSNINMDDFIDGIKKFGMSRLLVLQGLRLCLAVRHMQEH